MLLHYARLAVRLLVADRWFSLVNLSGLALGLASVALIGLYVRHEFNYDDFLPNSETLYRIDTVETAPGHEPIEIALAPGPLAPALRAQFPQIEQISRAYRFEATTIRDNQPFAEMILAADPNLFSVLGLPFAAGAPDRALTGGGSIAISERAAEKYFGTAEAIGRRMTLRLPQTRDFTVSAIFRTIPDNSHLDFDIVIPHAAYFGAAREDVMAIPDSWGGAYFHTYARLRGGTDPADIQRHLPALVDRSFPASLREIISTAPHEVYQFRFVPAADIHFEGAPIEAMRPPSSRTALVALSFVAVLILLIACINFGNLLAARSTLRAREVALRKVVGAARSDIIVQFLFEALLVAGVAGLFSVAVVEIALPYLEASLALPAHYLRPDIGTVWLGMAALIFATAATAGVYPSLMISKIRPAAVFNREFARRSGGGLRGILMFFQFAISIALVTVTIVMLMQWRLTQRMDLGFDREGLMVVRAPEGDEGNAQARAFADALARLPGVERASLSSAVPSDVSENNLTIRHGGESRPIQLGFHRVDNDFFATYAVAPLAGRTSTMRAGRLGTGAAERSGATPVILNRSSLRRLGFDRPEAAIGQVLQGRDSPYEIIGVVPDLHFRSLHAPVRDEVFVLDETAGNNISLRVAPGREAEVASRVDRLWRERFPAESIDRAALADLIDDLYAKDARQLVLLTLFAGLAIILSCVGLLAMAAFALQRRTKEIALRKVLGARTADILRLLLWDFLKPVLLANLIAWPVAWYVTRNWLDTFSYRIEMPPIAFAAATLATLILAAAAVIVHSVRSSRLHPAPALRWE